MAGRKRVHVFLCVRGEGEGGREREVRVRVGGVRASPLPCLRPVCVWPGVWLLACARRARPERGG